MTSCFGTEDRHGSLLGTTNGFILPPLKLMHCDTMQIFTRSVFRLPAVLQKLSH